jgi:hypothetical protein
VSLSCTAPFTDVVPSTTVKEDPVKDAGPVTLSPIVGVAVGPVELMGPVTLTEVTAEVR